MPVRSSKYLDDRPARLHRKPLERLDACIPACYIADRAQAGGELAGCEFGDAVAPAPDVRRHEMRILGQPLDRPAYARVIGACRKHGKFAGMGGVYAPALMQKFIAMGVQFILAGSEVSFLMTAAKERAGVLRALDPKA